MVATTLFMSTPAVGGANDFIKATDGPIDADADLVPARKEERVMAQCDCKPRHGCSRALGGLPVLEQKLGAQREESKFVRRNRTSTIRWRHGTLQAPLTDRFRHEAILGARLQHHVGASPWLIVDQAPFMSGADVVFSEQHIAGIGGVNVSPSRVLNSSVPDSVITY